MQAENAASGRGLWPSAPAETNLLYNTSENHQNRDCGGSMWKKNLGVDVKLQNQGGKPTSIAVIPVISM
jgi:hypothetical protein